jgi:glycosyltransferase involved in cell wall biosynthesis
MKSKTKKQKITILIPCHNEEKGIAPVINGMPFEMLKTLGFDVEIIVIDNDSTDKTAKVVKQLDVTLIHEPKKGKGNAMRTGFAAVSDDTDYVVMLDGDNTYKPEEIPRLIEPLASGFADVIVGSRLGGRTLKDALSFQNRTANWGFTFLVRQFYKANVTDVLSGFFAWRKDVVDELSKHLKSEGFSIEMEMITKTVRLGYSMYSVPITYDVRKGKSKISAFKDATVILHTLGKNIFWKPPAKPAKLAGKPNTSMAAKE